MKDTKCSLCESVGATPMVVCGETVSGGPLCSECQKSLFGEATERFAKEYTDSKVAKSVADHAGMVVKGGDA